MPLVRSFDITLGTCLRVLGIFLLVVLIVFYVLFQSRSFIQGPTISLSGDYTAVQHERSITLEGNARNIVKLTVNGKEIHTDAHGEFKHTLVLENGYTIVSLNAQDRFGRETSIVREYVYVPKSAT